jgi:hypothetical protein
MSKNRITPPIDNTCALYTVPITEYSHVSTCANAGGYAVLQHSPMDHGFWPPAA